MYVCIPLIWTEQRAYSLYPTDASETCCRIGQSLAERAEAEAFTSFAHEIENTTDLAWVAEPCSVIKEKLIRRPHGLWVRKVNECTFLGPVGCARGRHTPTIPEAKKTIKAKGTWLLHQLEQWKKDRLAQLPEDAYKGLPYAEACAWNLWLDKLMDHVKTVARQEGTVAAANNIVRCFHLIML